MIGALVKRPLPRRFVHSVENSDCGLHTPSN
ncbi:hypothetical protein FRIGORI9N_470184 [Frigoribacterium sp. 9N]|nr:hypothetical protein FRIGORI9N_470184 [Frigoribacterium sp. 9N]